MSQPKMAPMFRPPELRHYPAEYPLLWQWHRYGEYIAGFETEERANFYGKMKGWLK